MSNNELSNDALSNDALSSNQEIISNHEIINYQESSSIDERALAAKLNDELADIESRDARIDLIVKTMRSCCASWPNHRSAVPQPKADAPDSVHVGPTWSPDLPFLPSGDCQHDPQVIKMIADDISAPPRILIPGWVMERDYIRRQNEREASGESAEADQSRE